MLLFHIRPRDGRSHGTHTVLAMTAAEALSIVQAHDPAVTDKHSIVTQHHDKAKRPRLTIQLTDRDVHTVTAALVWFKQSLEHTGSAPLAAWKIVGDVACGGDPSKPACVAMTADEVANLDDDISRQAWMDDDAPD